MNINNILINNLEALWFLKTATLIKKEFDINFSISLIRKNNDNISIEEYLCRFKKYLRGSDRIISINGEFLFILFPYSSIDHARGAIDRIKNIENCNKLQSATIEVTISNSEADHFTILVTEAFRNGLGNLSSL